MRLTGSVDSRVRTSLRYAYGAWPFRRSKWCSCSALTGAQGSSEKPVAAPERDRPDLVLEPDVVGPQVAVAEVVRERGPAVEVVVDGPGGGRAVWHSLTVQPQPLVQCISHRHSTLLADASSFVGIELANFPPLDLLAPTEKFQRLLGDLALLPGPQVLHRIECSLSRWLAPSEAPPLVHEVGVQAVFEGNGRDRCARLLEGSNDLGRDLIAVAATRNRLGIFHAICEIGGPHPLRLAESVQHGFADAYVPALNPAPVVGLQLHWSFDRTAAELLVLIDC